MPRKSDDDYYDVLDDDADDERTAFDERLQKQLIFEMQPHDDEVLTESFHSRIRVRRRLHVLTMLHPTEASSSCH